MCEVNVATGELLRFETDFFYPGYIPIELDRLYRSNSSLIGTLGRGWANSLDVFLRNNGGSVTFHDGTGEERALEGQLGGRELVDATGSFVFRLEEGFYVFEDDNGWQHHFSPFGVSESRAPRVFTTDRPHTNVVRYSYAFNGLLKSIVDTLEREFRFEYDSAEHLTGVIIRASAESTRVVKRYIYSNAGDLVAVVDRMERVQEYEYDDRLLVRETSPDRRSIYWAYDRLRRCICTWRDGGVLWRGLAFDQVRRGTQLENSLGYVTVYQSDEKDNVISHTDPLGNVTTKAYDSEGLLLAESGPDAISEGLASYDESNRCLTQTTPNGSAFRQFFDDHGRRIRVVDDRANEWTTTYDEDGREVGETGPGGATWTFEYDKRGYLHKTSTPSGGVMYRSRSDDGKEETYWDDIGVLDHLRFDPFGNLVEAADGEKVRFRFEYDPSDRLIAIVNPDGTRRICEYDADDNIVSIMDEAAGVRRYEYDVAGKPIREIAPDGNASALAWDTEGNLREVRNPRGDLARFSYDACDRLSGIELFDGRVVRTAYDGKSRSVAVEVQGRTFQYEYDGRQITAEILPDGSRNSFSWQNGLLTSAGNITGTVQREYDSGKRLIAERFEDWEALLQYDLAGRHVHTGLSTGRTTKFGYDIRDRVTSISDSRLGSHKFGYNLSDALTSWEVEGCLRVEYSYDAQGRRTSATAFTQGGALISSYQWEYDPRDMRLSELFRDNFGGQTTQYRNDLMERVTQVVRNGTVVEWYDYDPNSNVTADATLGRRDIGTGDRLHAAGNIRLEYDEFGRVVAWDDPMGHLTLEYDHSNRLIMAHFPGGSQAEYGYDAVGRRVSKIFNGKTTSYGWLADEILCARSGNATEDFLFFPGCWIPLAWRQEDEFRIFICDPIGAPIEMLDPNGSVVWRRATTLWGQPLAESSAGEFCPFGFAGHFRDAESGFHYNYYRYYAPQLGRFLTSDPLEIEGGFNLYVGCSNPLTQIDPFGLFEALLNRRCDWSDAQKRAFAKKVEHYERLIERAQRKGKRGHKVSPCYSSRSARDVWEQDCGKKPPKQKKPKGKGASADCTKDIDHSTDKQLGGKNDCDNLKPLNSSVNRSLGTQMAREIREHIKSKGQKWAYLTAIKVAPPKCPETQRRTKNCI